MDEYVNDVAEVVVDDAIDIGKEAYKENELKAIVDLARNIGLYEWKYDTPIAGTDKQLHIGPIAQDLLRLPELASAVVRNGDHLEIDSKYIALAALSYVATLARIIANTEYAGPNITGSTAGSTAGDKQNDSI